MRHTNIPIFLPHVGCPHRCVFCEQNKISHSGNVPAPSEIPAIIERHCATLDKSTTSVELAFFGGTFTALPRPYQESYLSSAQPFLHSGFIDGIRLSTRPDYIDQEILAFLMKWGVTTIELGVQSFSTQVLERAERGYISEQVIQACRLVKQNGFKLGIQLMIGLPGDTPELDYWSTWLTIQQTPDFVRIYPTLVIQGTELEKTMAAGEYNAMSLEQAVLICKNMYLSFQASSIPVIRIGLHPGEELRNAGTILGGPFHPAFGELVEQAAYNEQASTLLSELVEEYPGLNKVRLQVHKKELSKMIGWKKQNILTLRDQFRFEQLRVEGDETIPCGTIVACFESGDPEKSLSRDGFLLYRKDPCRADFSVFESV